MELEDILENEWYVVRHSGEIPEIAFNSSIYYLTRSPNGPKLTLEPDQRNSLLQAACDRYREIVLRDIDHRNLDSSGYRGIARTIANYERYRAFCKRQELDAGSLDREVREQLQRFLETERDIVAKGVRTTVINCSREELLRFCQTLGLAPPVGIDIFFRAGNGSRTMEGS